MPPLKNPEVDLKFKYRKTLELSLIFSLMFHFAIFHALPKIRLNTEKRTAKAIEIKVEDIPPTEQIKQAPPPPRPSVPVPTEDEDVPEDLTIESTELNLDLSSLPPPPSQGDDIEDQYVFVPFDEPPVPIGGMAAIGKHLVYPALAKKAGFEGTVVIGVLIDEKGNPVKTQILKAVGVQFGFGEAAHNAVMAVKWKPAKQRDRAVKVWVSIPIQFRLTEGNPNAS
ncbi:MAG: energy transducer TonB [bacterium]